ncbi:MAG: hypothetical protein ACKVS9_13660 [Phycisphaerae bacterium]
MSEPDDPSLRRARRWRKTWIVLVSLSLTAFAATWGWRGGLLDSQSRGVWIGNGVLCVGYNLDLGTQPFWEHDPYPVDHGGWRPVRYAGTTWNYVGFPLWQPIAIFAPLWAYCHGFIRGSRQSDPSRCKNCGYSLRGLIATTTGERRCPECGESILR